LTRDIFYNFYFCLSSTFFTFFNIFLLSFYFPALFPAHCLQRVVSYHRFSLLSTPFFKKV